MLSLFSLRNNQLDRERSIWSTALILIWLLGVVFGCIIGYQTPVTVTSLMRTLEFGCVSIVWLLLSAVLPFFLSYIFLRYSFRPLLFLLVYLKAFCFAYSTCCICSAFTDAGWLMRYLCFFTDSVCSAIFLWYILNSPGWSVSQMARRSRICLAAVVALACFDYFTVTPFVALLLNY